MIKSLSYPGINLFCSSCLFFLFLPGILCAQLRFEHSIQQVAHAGVLYSGLDNKIRISGRDMNATLNFSSSAGSALATVPGGCVIRPLVKAGLDTLRVTLDGYELGYRVFRVLPTADPFPQLAFSPDTSMPLGRILNNPWLGVWHPDGKSASGMRVLSFNCAMRSNNGEAFYFTSDSNRLTPEILAVLKRLRKESVIEFDQIRVSTGKDQPARFLSPLKVVVQ